MGLLQLSVVCPTKDRAHIHTQRENSSKGSKRGSTIMYTIIIRALKNKLAVQQKLHTII